MSTNLRTCPDCGAAVEGRPNKIFCNGVCKGRYFRSTNSPEHTSEDLKPVELPQIAPLRHVAITHWAVEPDEVTDEATEDADTDQQQARALHAQFGALLRELFDLAGRPLTGMRIRNLASDADRLSVAYASHPHRKGPNRRQIKDRLNALHDVNDFLKEEAEGVRRNEKTSFEIDRPWLKQLRKLLIED